MSKLNFKAQKKTYKGLQSEVFRRQAKQQRYEIKSSNIMLQEAKRTQKSEHKNIGNQRLYLVLLQIALYFATHAQ